MSKTQKPTKNSCEDCRDGSVDKDTFDGGWTHKVNGENCPRTSPLELSGTGTVTQSYTCSCVGGDTLP